MIIIGNYSEKHKRYIDENLQNEIDSLIDNSSNQNHPLKDITYEIRMLDYDQTEDLDDIDILVTYKLSNEHFHKMNSLKTIILPMTGLDNLGSDVLASKDIKIINAHSTAPYIAERGMAILMTLLGRVAEHSEALKENHWLRIGPENAWISLHNKRVGIYGYGHIGKLFRQMILPFNPEIYVINRNKDYSQTTHEKPLNLVKDLDELTKVSDILFIATPANEHTIDSISERELMNMKDGFLVNIGRGKIVNQRALHKALKDNIIKGYGSDVWYNYPDTGTDIQPPSDYDLSPFKNVVMTPHNAWNMDAKIGLVEKEIVENIIDLLLEEVSI